MHRLSRLDSTSILRSTIRAKYLLASYSTSTDTFINANSASYVDQMYSSWQTDSKSVHLSWQIYFDSLHTSKHPSSLFTPPPTILPQAEGKTLHTSNFSYIFLSLLIGAAGFIAPQTLNIPSQNVLEHMKVQLMVRAYQVISIT